MQQITYREYKKEDDIYLEKIICDTWEFNTFCSSYIAEKLSKIYLYGCLNSQSYTQVAILDEQPMGIIMCANKQKVKSKLSIKIILLKQLFFLLSKKEGRIISKAFQAIERIDNDLLKSVPSVYQGELVFFAVNNKFRELGIGNTLFNKALTYMDNQGIDTFYLFTDSSCNYHFYDRQGMNRIAEKTYSVPIQVNNEMKFYLYEYRGETNGK